jgi:hypothetical protein
MPNRVQGRWYDSNGFQLARTSNHSNRFATIANILNSVASPQMSTGLGDQGSQVRVLSPRLSSILNTGMGVSSPVQPRPARSTQQGLVLKLQ